MRNNSEQPPIHYDTRANLKKILSSDTKNRARLMGEIRERLKGYTIDPKDKNAGLEVLPMNDSAHSLRIISPYGNSLEIDIPSVQNSTFWIWARPQKYRIVGFGNLIDKTFYAPSLVVDTGNLLEIAEVFFSIEQQIYSYRWPWTAILLTDRWIETAKWEIIRDFDTINLSKDLLNIVIEALWVVILKGKPQQYGDKEI